MTKGQLLSESEYYDALDEYGDDVFEAGIGAEAIRNILIDIDLEAERENVREDLKSTGSETKRKKIGQSPEID